MKQWAIKTPKDVMIPESVMTTKYESWKEAHYVRSSMCKGWACCANYNNEMSVNKKHIDDAKAKGYKCVRVEVTEVKK